MEKMNKTVIVTGVPGQLASYLCELLLDQENVDRVIGISRRSSRSNDNMINCTSQPSRYKDITMDITDASGIRNIIDEYRPDFLYNLGAQTYVHQSFNEPLNHLMTNAYAVANMLECIRSIKPSCRYYQASTSELFGKSYKMDAISILESEDYPEESLEVRYQDETTEFLPRSPYAVAKLYAHHMVRIYREAYNLFACTGILFNSESPRRGVDFVTRKITYNIARIKLGLQDTIKLGNLDAYRDINYAKDSVRAIYMILEANQPDDYVIATGESVQIKEILKFVCDLADLDWQKIYEIDKNQLRPADVPYLRGDSIKLRNKLGWAPTQTWRDTIRDMYEYDLSQLKKEMSMTCERCV